MGDIIIEIPRCKTEGCVEATYTTTLTIPEGLTLIRMTVLSSPCHPVYNFFTHKKGPFVWRLPHSLPAGNCIELILRYDDALDRTTRIPPLPAGVALTHVHKMLPRRSTITYFVAPDVVRKEMAMDLSCFHSCYVHGIIFSLSRSGHAPKEPASMSKTLSVKLISDRGVLLGETVYLAQRYTADDDDFAGYLLPFCKEAAALLDDPKVVSFSDGLEALEGLKKDEGTSSTLFKTPSVHQVSSFQVSGLPSDFLKKVAIYVSGHPKEDGQTTASCIEFDAHDATIRADDWDKAASNITTSAVSGWWSRFVPSSKPAAGAGGAL